MVRSHPFDAARQRIDRSTELKSGNGGGGGGSGGGGGNGSVSLSVGKEIDVLDDTGIWRIGRITAINSASALARVRLRAMMYHASYTHTRTPSTAYLMTLRFLTHSYHFIIFILRIPRF